MSRKKILIISYYWYPFAGVGAYRVSRFIKYLLRNNWEVVILTTKKSASGITQQADHPIFGKCKVYRSNIIEPVGLLSSGDKNKEKTSNPSIFYRKNTNWKSKLAVWARLNLMVPDAKFTWKWFAVPLGKKIIKKENPDIILSTSPPPTTNLIAKKLAGWSKLPWVADFRDPWTNIYYYDDNPQSKRAKKKNQKLEAAVLGKADHITVVNNGFFPENNIDGKVTRITNGFDPDDIVENTEQIVTNSKFTIRYFGSMKINQKPDSLISALKNIEDLNPKIAGNLAFEFYGSIDPDIQAELKKSSSKIEFSFTDYISHKEMMRLTLQSDLLLLTIGKSRNSKFALSTKVFEYMISGKPVLGIGPVDGAASELVQKTNIGEFFEHTDSAGVFKFILKVFEASKKEQTLFERDQDEVDKYSFKNLSSQLIEILEHQIERK
ncbi:glycosyltransferase family 4 protein [bacterium]|nr:glycosyltransferase family 4 protein [bacterium]